MKRALLALALTAMGLSSCSDHASPNPLSTETTAEAEEAVLTKPCPFLDTTDPLFYTGTPIDFARELMITDLSVVNDPCRTTWTGPCAAGATQGIWTFGELMTRMAGMVPPADFVAEWLHEWEIPLTINGYAVPPRPGIRAAFIDDWLAASGCPMGAPLVGPGSCALDLQRAPFRLLAIVNRPDLECAGYTGPGDGEARFVFGVIDAFGNPLQAAVILEYKLPPLRGGAPYTAADWENDWHPLSSLPLGSPAYLALLESLLDDITRIGAIPGGPNLGTAIGQVRTNEIDFNGPPWKLREARLQNVSSNPNAQLLLATTTAETPDDSQNGSGLLDAYLLSNSTATFSNNLMAFLQPPIPAALSGGETSAPLPFAPPFWDHSTPTPLLLQPIERHHFAFNTCNGCHTMETGTPFLHVSNRPFSLPATLSPFLSVSPASTPVGTPTAAHLVSDPATGTTFQYNEPFRRVCEATRMLQGYPQCWTRANGAH